MRTYSNHVLQDYIKSRYHSQQPVRMAIMPFYAPASFAGVPGVQDGLGAEIARRVHAEMIRTGEVPIVEFFNRAKWPGEKEDFFTGNYRAIDLARDAGYDLMMVGHMEAPVNDEELTVYSKIIDTSNNVSVWYAKTLVYARDRGIRQLFARYRIVDDRPDLFYFNERLDEYGHCIVKRILTADPVPQ